MNIVLIGYRGTGKSHVGFLLGERFGRKVISIDEEIVKTAGMLIPEIVDKFGWDKFRDMETDEARKLAGQDQLVIDCGGGIIERSENIGILQQNATIFWLQASVEAIVARIQHSTERPALVEGKTFTEEVAEVLERRTPLYQAAAHHTISTDNRTPQQVSELIAEFLENATKRL